MSKKIELLGSAKVRKCNPRYCEGQGGQDFPAPLGEDVMGIRVKDGEIYGYLADAASPNPSELYGLDQVFSRILARIMGEIFVELIEKKEFSDEKELENFWYEFKKQLKQIGSQKVNYTMSFWKDFLRNEFFNRNINILSMPSPIQAQVAFIGFYWDLKEDKLFLWQYGDGDTIIGYNDNTVKILRGSTTFAIFVNNKKEMGGYHIDKIVDNSPKNKFLLTENVRDLFVVSDGIYDKLDLSSGQNMQEIYQLIKEKALSEFDDKSAILITDDLKNMNIELKDENVVIKNNEKGINQKSVNSKENKKKLTPKLKLFSIVLILVAGFFFGGLHTLVNYKKSKAVKKIYLNMMNKYGMLESNDKLRKNILHYAAAGGNLNFMKIFKKEKPQIFKKLLNSPDIHGRTPIFYAIENRNVETIMWMIKNGAKLDIVDRDSVSPLLLAIKTSNSDIVKSIVRGNWTK